MQATNTIDPIATMLDPRHTAQPATTAPAELVTVRELAGHLRVSTGFVYKLAKQGRIPSVRIGRAVRFNVGEVERALQKAPSRRR